MSTDAVSRAAEPSAPDAPRRIWVGGYTDDMNGSAEGIGLLTISSDGSLENHGLGIAAPSPSFLTRNGDVIYATLEGENAVAAYRIAGNELHFLGQQPTAGTTPCAAAVLGDGAALGVACYSDGTVDIHPLGAGGTLGKTGQSLRGAGRGSLVDQDGPHAHCVLELADGVVLTADLGTDDVYVHTRTDELLTRTGSVTFPTGSGPRDLHQHPSGVILVLAELGNELFALARNGSGFDIAARVGLPGAQDGDHGAAIAVSTDGRFVYSLLRGSDNIAVIEISGDGLTLTPVGAVGSGGGWPRHLIVEGERIHVANQLTSSVTTFAIGADGMPTEASSLSVPSPTYLLLA